MKFRAFLMFSVFLGSAAASFGNSAFVEHFSDSEFDEILSSLQDQQRPLYPVDAYLDLGCPDLDKLKPFVPTDRTGVRARLVTRFESWKKKSPKGSPKDQIDAFVREDAAIFADWITPAEFEEALGVAPAAGVLEEVFRRSKISWNSQPASPQLELTLRAVTTLTPKICPKLTYYQMASYLAYASLVPLDPALLSEIRHKSVAVRLPSCAIPRGTTEWGRKLADWSMNAPNYGGWESVLSLIETTPVGKKVVEQVRRKMRDGELHVVLLTPEVRKTAHIDPNHTASYRPHNKTIYINYLSPQLGQLAPILFHELAHAVDPLLDLALNEYTGFDVSSVERHAFKLEHEFKKQLAQQNPCYLKYLKAAADGHFLKMEMPTYEEIESAYRVSVRKLRQKQNEDADRMAPPAAAAESEGQKIE